jgi:hypothetical protein
MLADAPNATAVAVPLALLKSKTIIVLTDSYMHAFTALHGEEMARRTAAKARLAAELASLDVFAAEPNHEDYTPGGDVS